MLSLGRELAFIRNQIQQTFPDTVSIYNIAETLSGEGYKTKSRTLVANKHGVLVSPSGSERQLLTDLIDTGNENTETIKLILPFGTDIEVSQEVDTADGKHWQVIHTTTSQTLTGGVEALLYRRTIDDTEIDNV